MRVPHIRGERAPPHETHAMSVDRRPRPFRLATVTLAVIGLIAAIAGGCQGTQPNPLPGTTPGATGEASASPSTGISTGPSSSEPAASPVATPSPAREAEPSAASTVFAPDSAVRTVTDGLRVRSKPGVSAASVKLEPLLGTKILLFVIAGPVAADGYDWYHVMPFDGIAPTGWVAAAARDGTPWLAPASLACPAPPLDGQAVLDLSSLGGLVCYGDREIQLVGDVTCENADVDRVFGGPEWLHSGRYCRLDLGGETREFFDGGIEGLGLPTRGRARVTGHFDDPAALTCVWAVEPPAPDPASVVVNCRAMFVATELN